MKLEKLLTIEDCLIKDLSSDKLKELQLALQYLGYPVETIDGLYGPKTRNAWAEFKEDIYQGKRDWIGKGSVNAIQEKLKDEVEHNFSTKEGTVAAIIHECKRQVISLKTQIAYVLATTEWETNYTFQPVKECYWLSEEWRMKNLPYAPFYGQGYAQMTWYDNYLKYERLLGIPLTKEPNLALKPEVALFILVHGFKVGTFTGRKITDYINETKTDLLNCRRCINGTDKAKDIAELAKLWLSRLN